MLNATRASYRAMHSWASPDEMQKDAAPLVNLLEGAGKVARKAPRAAGEAGGVLSRVSERVKSFFGRGGRRAAARPAGAVAEGEAKVMHAVPEAPATGPLSKAPTPKVEAPPPPPPAPPAPVAAAPVQAPPPRTGYNVYSGANTVSSIPTVPPAKPGNPHLPARLEGGVAAQHGVIPAAGSAPPVVGAPTPPVQPPPAAGTFEAMTDAARNMPGVRGQQAFADAHAQLLWQFKSQGMSGPEAHEAAASILRGERPHPGLKVPEAPVAPVQPTPATAAPAAPPPAAAAPVQAAPFRPGVASLEISQSAPAAAAGSPGAAAGAAGAQDLSLLQRAKNRVIGGESGAWENLRAGVRRAERAHEEILAKVRAAHGDRWDTVNSTIKRLEDKAAKAGGSLSPKDHAALAEAHRERIGMLGQHEKDFVRAERDLTRAREGLTEHEQAMLARRGIVMPEVAEAGSPGAAAGAAGAQDLSLLQRAKNRVIGGESGAWENLRAGVRRAERAHEEILAKVRAAHGDRWDTVNSTIKRLEDKAAKAGGSLSPKDHAALAEAHRERIGMLGQHEKDFVRAERDLTRAREGLTEHEQAMLARRGIVMPEVAEAGAKGKKGGQGAWYDKAMEWAKANPVPAVAAGVGGGALLGGAMFGGGGRNHG